MCRKKILVLDDEEAWLFTIKTILEADYDLTLTTDPLQAKELLKAGDYSLVILDKRLPQISGMEVLSQMRNIAPNLRAIMLTGYADVSSAVESMKIGALDYLEKGSRNLFAELKARVEEALNKKLLSEAEAVAVTQTEEQVITALIAKGESAELEFKSSARWDMKLEKLNKDLEIVIVKTVAAFLNSEKGGTLLIGIDDDGNAVGLHHDYKTFGRKQNRDVYENFLITLLLEAYGKDYSALIHIVFHRLGEKDICQIIVKPSPKAVFVKDNKGEHLFIRAGNSTRLLSTREAIEYCKIRWG